MKRNGYRLAIMFALVVVAANLGQAAVRLLAEGTWPQSWPKELEPLRKVSQSTSVMTGIQESIYTIPFTSRDEFERMWPYLLQVKSKGGKIILYGADQEKPWTFENRGEMGEQSKVNGPCVRVFAPSESYRVSKHVNRAARDVDDLESMQKQGMALHAGGPWPEEVYSADGVLPEYVVSAERDGKLVWQLPVRGDPNSTTFNRARIDLELTVDGDVIDLNRIPIPRDTEIIDKRWDPETKKNSPENAATKQNSE